MHLLFNIGNTLLFFSFISGATPLFAASSSEADIENIELVGTITGKHQLAIIRVLNQSDKIYQLHQKILGYSIKSITIKTVTLEKRQKLYTLDLIAIQNRKLFTSRSMANISQVDVNFEYRINRKTFDTLSQDTQSWLDDVGLELQLDDGYWSGYKITYVRENSPAELLGLVTGDIIKGINDIAIRQNAEKFIQHISQLSNVTQFTLNMKHDNNDFTITIIIDDEK